MTAVPNGQLTTGNVRPGDAVVWTTGGVGHIAVVRSVSGSGGTFTINILEQNFGVVGNVTRQWGTDRLSVSASRFTGNRASGAVGVVHAPGNRINPTRWYQVQNLNSRMVVDVRGAGTANGTVLQQYPSNASSAAQRFRFVPTSQGYYRVQYQREPSRVWEVGGGRTTDRSKTNIWTWVNVSHQQWKPVSTSTATYFQFRPRHASSKCLDVPGGSTSASVQLQIYTCNATGAQRWRLVA